MATVAARLLCKLCGRASFSASQMVLSRTCYRTLALPKETISSTVHGELDEIAVIDIAKQEKTRARRPTPTWTRGGNATAGLELIRGEANAADSWTRMHARGLVGVYLELSKARLTALISCTTLCGYLMNPGALDAILASPIPLVSCLVGTALLSAQASAYNQLFEAPYDAQMKRTQTRALVVHRVSPLHAFAFANVVGLTGIAILAHYSNALTLSLGALNVLLYAGVYTPLKRHHIACTWAGALVGAIPPLMGWAAVGGGLNPAALVLAGILYSWQFPHFNALSWNLRGDYSRAGYRVMCVTNQRLCRTTTIRSRITVITHSACIIFRHAVALLALCSIAAPLSDLTTYTFAISSLPLNAYMLFLSYKFSRSPDSRTSRFLFRYSLLYLPLIMLLMLISTYGRNAQQRKGGIAAGGSDGRGAPVGNELS